MSPPSWKTPSAPADYRPAAFRRGGGRRASTADAVVLHVLQGESPLAALSRHAQICRSFFSRTSTSKGRAPAHRAGRRLALPTASSMHEIARAARFAIARRSRQDRRPAASQMVAPFADAPQLQAIARLAGGIAHEFNNLLTVVEASVEQLFQGLPEQSALREAADGISTAAREATVLTRQLLGIRPSADAHSRCHRRQSPGGRCVAGGAQRAGRQRAADDGARPRPGARACRPRSVRPRWLSNLALTAHEAMPGGGTFTITSDMHAVTDEERRHRPWLPGGRFVRVRVTDTGLGMEEQALPHLFEPFFTATRHARQGTGDVIRLRRHQAEQRIHLG